ncbi:IS110 family transposase [Brachybacterium sp. p3-SID1565]|uniref:IS110 family transposase n=1 Tax=Brachybacterium epidermidis TaxID=2781983 RepID=A0ABR9W0V8_9MICO|nr:MULTISPECIES: IS110 family transposase [Brachybacterium]MBE9404052.1 IS110 family transposase [Brachybacterium epidermidis]MCT1385483.1 IS110 family transposase [Brachybacterium sp. p3-SID1565]MCT1777257.1 IS110 family transposase [Brachybacterium sp. p3-SID957]PZO64819.1 MAG: IS110 family transposase [Pelagerythrobacter marensis]
MFVGWDWGNTTHAVAVIDGQGQTVDRWLCPHSEDGLRATFARLAGHGAPAELPVAIETTRGLVVDRILAAGHPVVAVHPNAFNAVRPRWGAARAKDDPGDAFKLADYLRTDGRRLRTLRPTEQVTLELQALVRAREDQVTARVTATNQLAALLAEHWPGAGMVFARLDSDIALAFCDRFPAPATARRLAPARMRDWLARQHYSGRNDPTVLVAKLRDAPAPASRLGEETITALVRAQVAVIRALKTAIDELEAQIDTALAAHPWAALIKDLPRVGTVNLAQLIGEIGPLLEHTASADQLAAEAGVVPVTRASGKSRAVVFRYATNRRARQALVRWADNSRHASPWARNIYDTAREQGKRHPHAVRILARSWLRIIYACWRDGTCYDPAAHERRRTEKTDHITALAA